MDPWSRSGFLLAARNLPFEERMFFAKSWNPSSGLEEILLKWVRTK
jgi:hypothetical protein